MLLVNSICIHALIGLSVLVKGFEGKNIVQIASGQQHSIAIDDAGYVYVYASKTASG